MKASVFTCLKNCLPKIILIAISALGGSQFAHATSSGAGVSPLAPNEVCLAARGEMYCEPFFFSKATQVSTYGRVNYSAALEKVERYGLKPIAIGANDAVMVITNIQYGQTTFGAYDEFVIMLPVQIESESHRFNTLGEFLTASGSINKDASKPVFGNFMLKLYLDGSDRDAVTLAVVGGKAVYGYPKEIGLIALDYSGEDKTFSVKDSFGDFQLDAKFLGGASPVKTFPIKTDSFAITKGNGPLQWERMEVRGTMSMPRSMASNTFVLRLSGEMEILMKDMNFVGELWTVISDMEFKLTGVK